MPRRARLFEENERTKNKGLLVCPVLIATKFCFLVKVILPSGFEIEKCMYHLGKAQTR